MYITDGMKACAGNLAGAFGGSVMSVRWEDLYEPIDDRDAETIIDDIKQELRNMENEHERI